MSKDTSVRRHDDVLGYLLKHAFHAVEERTDAALAPLGVTSRDLGVLRVIAAGEAQSQQEISGVFGVDRTSMVALLDSLERAGIVARRADERDRRRNVIELTDSGRNLLAEAERTSLEVERAFTDTIGGDATTQLRAALRALLAH